MALELIQADCYSYLQEIVPHSFEEFDRRSGGEVAGPIRVRVTRVGEEVVGFR